MPISRDVRSTLLGLLSFFSVCIIPAKESDRSTALSKISKGQLSELCLRTLLPSHHASITVPTEMIEDTPSAIQRVCKASTVKQQRDISCYCSAFLEKVAVCRRMFLQAFSCFQQQCCLFLFGEAETYVPSTYTFC